MMSPIIVGLIFFIATAVFVGQPLRKNQYKRAQPTDINQILEQKETLIDKICELDRQYGLGEFDKDAYERERRKFVYEAANICYRVVNEFGVDLLSVAARQNSINRNTS